MTSSSPLYMLLKGQSQSWEQHTKFRLSVVALMRGLVIDLVLKLKNWQTQARTASSKI